MKESYVMGTRIVGYIYMGCEENGTFMKESYVMKESVRYMGMELYVMGCEELYVTGSRESRDKKKQEKKEKRLWR